MILKFILTTKHEEHEGFGQIIFRTSCPSRLRGEQYSLHLSAVARNVIGRHTSNIGAFANARHTSPQRRYQSLEQGQTAFVAFTPVDIENAVAMAGTKLDGVAFEMEHAPLDFPGLRNALQFMLDRGQIVAAAPSRPRSHRWCAYRPTASK